MLAAYHALYGAARALFESERTFWVVAISLAHGVTLLSTSACFLALDRFPSMDKYRLQDKRAPEALFRQAFRGLFFNSAVTYPVFALLLYPIARGFVAVSGDAPSASETAAHLLGCILVRGGGWPWRRRRPCARATGARRA